MFIRKRRADLKDADTHILYWNIRNVGICAQSTRKLHLNLNFSCQMQQESLKSYKEFQNAVNEIDCLEDLKLEMEWNDKAKMGTFSKYQMKLLRDDTILRHAKTISRLSVRCNDIARIQSELIDSNDSNQYGLLSPIMSIFEPLENLSHLTLLMDGGDYSKGQNSLLDSMSWIHDIIQEKRKLFSKMKNVEMDCSLKYRNSQSRYVSLSTQLLGAINAICSLESLQELRVRFSSQLFEYRFLKQFVECVQRCRGLSCLRIELIDNNPRGEDYLRALKSLSVLSNKITELKLVQQDYTLSKSGCKSFAEYLRAFTKLESLSLNGFRIQHFAVWEFFSGLCEFTRLKILRLDLSHLQISEGEFKRCFNQLGGIAQNLVSLQVVLPKYSSLRVSHLSPFCQFLIEASSSLQELDVHFSSMFCDESLIRFATTLKQISNLRELQVSFLSQVSNHSICFSSKTLRVPNIFELKEFKIHNPYDENFVNEYAYYTIIIYAIMSAQRYPLETFKYVVHSKRDNRLRCEPFHSFYKESMKQIYKQKQIKKLTFFQDYTEIDEKLLLSQNINTITSFSQKGSFIKQKEYYEQILCCSNLVSLNMSISQQISFKFSTLLSSLPQLQSLTIFQLMKYWIQEENEYSIDYTLLISTKYLNYIHLNGFRTTNNSFAQLIDDRQAQLLQIHAYNKLIQPFLQYQSQHSHWDLFIN